MALTMYIILRKDLRNLAGWTQGSIIAQAGHGVSKAIWKFQENDAMQRYLQDIDNMHKVVLEIKNQSQLVALGEQFKQENIEFVDWIEQPENITTCIVTRPYEPEQIRPYLKKCSLYK